MAVRYLGVGGGGGGGAGAGGGGEEGEEPDESMADRLDKTKTIID